MAEVDDLLKAANDVSAQARTTWFTYILFGAYLAVAVGSTTHKELLLGTPIELPLLNVRLPLVAFYRLVPGIFVLVHVYTLVQLYLLSRLLHLLNDKIIQSTPSRIVREELRAQTDSFMLTQLISGGRRGWLANLFVKLAAWFTMFPRVNRLEFCPPPWSVEEQDACFVVRDRGGQQLAYV
jgi:hypothetical protein